MDITEYIGCMTEFFFICDEGDRYSVGINELGRILISKNEDEQYWEFQDWLKFREEFPELEEVITSITVYKLKQTNEMMGKMQVEAAIDDINRNMYC